MTRLATCEGGTRLVRCGNRVQVCTDQRPTTCDGSITTYRCPCISDTYDHDMPECNVVVDRVIPWRAQVIEWEWEWEYIEERVRSYGTSELVRRSHIGGIAGYAFAWGRYPTIQEIRDNYGIAEGEWGDETFVIYPPYQFGEYTTGTFFAQRVIEEENGALGFQFYPNRYGSIELSWLPYHYYKINVSMSGPVLGPRTLDCFDAAFEHYAYFIEAKRTFTTEVSGDERVFKQTTEFFRRDTNISTPDTDNSTIIENEVTTVRILHEFPHLMDTWTGPQDWTPCEPVPEGPAQPASTDPNAEAIARQQQLDPQNRPGCCG